MTKWDKFGIFIAALATFFMAHIFGLIPGIFAGILIMWVASK